MSQSSQSSGPAGAVQAPPPQTSMQRIGPPELFTLTSDAQEDQRRWKDWVKRWKRYITLAKLDTESSDYRREMFLYHLDHSVTALARSRSLRKATRTTSTSYRTVGSSFRWTDQRNIRSVPVFQQKTGRWRNLVAIYHSGEETSVDVQLW